MPLSNQHQPLTPPSPTFPFIPTGHQRCSAGSAQCLVPRFIPLSHTVRSININYQCARALLCAVFKFHLLFGLLQALTRSKRDLDPVGISGFQGFLFPLGIRVLKIFFRNLYLFQFWVLVVLKCVCSGCCLRSRKSNWLYFCSWGCCCEAILNSGLGFERILVKFFLIYKMVSEILLCFLKENHLVQFKQVGYWNLLLFFLKLV